MNLDQYDDVQENFMEKIANAGIIINKRDDVDDLLDKDFALIIKGKRRHRKFPICDPKTAILSLLYFMKNIDNMPRPFAKTAGAKLKEACVKYDLSVPSKLDRFSTGADSNVVTEAELEKRASEVSEKKKKKLSDNDFGLIIEKNGEKIRKFPLHDKKHVIKAMEYYPKVKDKLDDPEKIELKDNIADRAEELGVETTVKKEASVETNPNVVRDMEFRVRHLKKEAQKPYIKLAEKLKEDEVKIKEASAVLDKLDKENNFDSGKMPAGEVFVNKDKRNSINKYASVNEFLKGFGKEKTAADTDYPRVIQQMLMDDEKKGKLIKELKQKFDKSLVKDLKQDPETIYESLPEPHQDLINTIVDEVRF